MPTALLLAAALHAASPVHLSPAAAESVARSIQTDRQETLKWLRGDPGSYLAAVMRRDFGDRSTLTVGSAHDNDVRVEGLSPHHLRVTVAGDSFHVAAIDRDAQFVRDSVPLREATLPPSGIALGRFRMRLSHQRFPALIVFDPQSPGFARYKGLKWYPVDLSWRYALPLSPAPHPDTVVILSTRGNRRRALRVGWFEFVAAGRRCRLEATRLLEPGVGEQDVSVFFRDATTGRETYAVGRYVDPEPLPDGRWVLDFNRAYNPACAISDHYNCPLPPRANVLPIAVRAGEMDSHYH